MSVLRFASALRFTPRGVTLVFLATAIAAMLWYGPIAQPAHYHDFADTRAWWGIPNAADVLSNLAFLAVGLWGVRLLWRWRADDRLALAGFGYALFVAGLIGTALGSAFYHWAPDDASLIWDRLPIALLCAGLLAASFAEVNRSSSWLPSILLSLFGAASVMWWSYTGDLRPYVLLQVAPLVLIPIWQSLRAASRSERAMFGAAMGIYVCSRLAELFDIRLYTLLGTISGHTLKHLLAAATAALILQSVAHAIENKNKEALSPLSAW